METFLSYLINLDKRPSMYIDPVNLITLAAFINGYQLGGIGKKYLFNGAPPYNFFSNWLDKKINNKVTHKSWIEIIGNLDQSEEEKVFTFFSFLKEFNKVRGNIIYEESLYNKKVFIIEYIFSNLKYLVVCGEDNLIEFDAVSSDIETLKKFMQKYNY